METRFFPYEKNKTNELYSVIEKERGFVRTEKIEDKDAGTLFVRSYDIRIMKEKRNHQHLY